MGLIFKDIVNGIIKFYTRNEFIYSIFSPLIITILFYLDLIIFTELTISENIFYLMLIFVLFSINWLSYSALYGYKPPHFTFLNKYLIVSLKGLISFLMLFSLMYLGFNLFNIYQDSEDKILSVFITVLWFNIIYFNKYLNSIDTKKGRILSFSLLFVFLYFLWTEAFFDFSFNIENIQPYFLFFDLVALFNAILIGLLLFKEIQCLLEKRLKESTFNKQKVIIFTSLFMIFYSLLIYEPYLYFIHQTSVFRYLNFWIHEFPIILIGITALHFNWYFIREKEKPLREGTENEKEESEYKTEFSIQLRKKNLLLSVEDIFCFLITGSITKVHIKTGEEFIIDSTLNQLESQLDPNLFFRINRQLILSRKSIIDYLKESNQKLKVIYMLDDTKKADAIISRYKAPNFKKWYKKI